MTTQDTALPPRRPSDVELIALLRARLNTVEEAAEAFLKVLEETGKQRQQAFELVTPHDLEALPTTARHFLAVYDQTIDARYTAAGQLHVALTIDFYTALLQCDDLTEAQIEKWFAPAPERPARAFPEDHDQRTAADIEAVEC